MKKLLFGVIIVIACLGLYGHKARREEPPKQSDVQILCSETMTAQENGDTQKANEGISELIGISKDSMYSADERNMAKYIAIYTNANMYLDYIKQYDSAWISQYDVSSLTAIHKTIAPQVISGAINSDDLAYYIDTLIQCSKPLHDRYQQLKN